MRRTLSFEANKKRIPGSARKGAAALTGEDLPVVNGTDGNGPAATSTGTGAGAPAGLLAAGPVSRLGSLPRG